MLNLSIQDHPIVYSWSKLIGATKIEVTVVIKALFKSKTSANADIVKCIFSDRKIDHIWTFLEYYYF